MVTHPGNTRGQFFCVVDAESDYAALDKTVDGGKNRKTAVFYDLNSNKLDNGYDLGKLTTYFNDMVATRLVNTRGQFFCVVI